MVSSSRDAFAVASLLFATVAHAIPAYTPIPTPAPAAAAVARAVSGSAPTGAPTSTLAGGFNSTNATSTQSFVYTFTDPTHGFIIGCTDTTSVSVSSAGISAGLWCNGPGVTLSTDLAIAHTTDVFNDPQITNSPNWTSVSNAYTGPSDGCSTVTTLDTSIASTTMTYCTCGNGEMGGLALGVSGTKQTTICQAKQTAMPSGFTQVPYGPGAPGWATPVSTGPCATPTALNQQCWSDLDINGYATWWWQQNNGTCAENEGFADCFYGAMTPYSPSQCADLTGNSDKCKQPVWKDFQKQWNGARNFYLAQTISNINSFFSQYYTAIGDASGIAADNVGQIVTTIDPLKNTNVGLTAAMTALAVGLAFIPGVGGPLGQGIITAAQQAPGIAKYAVPQGNTEESQTIDWGNIQAGLGTVTGWLQANITAATGAVETDIDNFLLVSNNGPYSGDLPTLDSLKNDILVGLYAYIISQAYTATKTVLLRQIDTDVNALGTNGTKLLWTPCNTGYYSNGTCGDGDFWYDSENNISYGLVDSGNPTTRFNEQINQFLGQASNGTELARLLFSGADQCQQQHAGSGPIIDFSGGTFSTPCLSSIKTCTWTMDPADPGSNGPLMTDCDLGSTLPGIGRGSCGSQDPNHISADPGDGTILPWTYLGWGMLSDLIGEHEFCEPYKASEF